MNVLLQNKSTLNYVQSPSGWTTNHEKARVFETGLEALFFCFNRHVTNMQILGEFADTRMNFTFPVTDLRGD
jgi:hypothetical protein